MLGAVPLTVRRTSEVLARGVDDLAAFCARLEDEIVRARSFKRPLSVLMIRSATREAAPRSRWSWRVRAELRPVDRITVYAPNVVLVLLPELARGDALTCAGVLVRRRPAEPQLLCGVATFPDTAQSSHHLIEAARSASCRSSAERPVSAVASNVDARSTPVVRNEHMVELYRVARRAGATSAPVLILGETGTGKELVARTVHDASSRRDRPFVAINCAALPPTLLESQLFGHEKGAFTGAQEARKGVFEEAQGGTLLLDEVGELSLPAQAALLRVIETKRLSRIGSTREIALDVRVLAATHCDLEHMAAAKTFRADLWHRLNVLALTVPPLRERQDELEPLALYFLEQLRRESDASLRALSPAALELLRRYAWPGNVRELRNVIGRAAMLNSGELLDTTDLPEALRRQAIGRALLTASSAARAASEGSGSFSAKMRAYELELITGALRETGGNQKEAAKVLDMPLRTLVHKIRYYGLRAASLRAGDGPIRPC